MLAFSRINRMLGWKRATPRVECVFVLRQTEIQRRGVICACLSALSHVLFHNNSVISPLLTLVVLYATIGSTLLRPVKTVKEIRFSL